MSSSSYKIPIIFEPFNKQKTAARLLHLLAGFLMIANAWGDFKQPTPNILFVVVQIAGAILVLLYAFPGSKLFRKTASVNSLFRLVEAAILLYAAWYFYGMNLGLMSLLQVIGSTGLLFLFFTERKIFAECFVVVDEKGIHTPTNFGSRLIDWKNIDNMLIRNDFVSINTKQNEFIQYPAGVVLSELQMDEINEFCRKKFTSG
jgi:hypothetical protein